MSMFTVIHIRNKIPIRNWEMNKHNMDILFVNNIKFQSVFPVFYIISYCNNDSHRGSAALTTQHPLTAKVGTNYVDKLQSI
jgi:hypothetical protein